MEIEWMRFFVGLMIWGLAGFAVGYKAGQRHELQQMARKVALWGPNYRRALRECGFKIPDQRG